MFVSTLKENLDITGKNLVNFQALQQFLLFTGKTEVVVHLVFNVKEGPDQNRLASYIVAITSKNVHAEL